MSLCPLSLRDGQLVFLSEEERADLSQLNPCDEQYHSGLLNKLSITDISTVYRLGEGSLLLSVSRFTSLVTPLFP